MVGCIIVDVHDDTEENILLGEVRAIIPESIVVAADCVSFLVKIIPKLVADFISLLLQYGGCLLARFIARNFLGFQSRFGRRPEIF